MSRKCSVKYDLNVVSLVCVMCQTWRQAQPPSRHQPMTSRPCPRSTPWPRTQTAAASTRWPGRWTTVSEHGPWPHLSACLGPPLVFTISKYQYTVNFLSLPPRFFVPFFRLSSSTSINRSIFLFSSRLWSANDYPFHTTSNIYFGLLLRGQSCVWGHRFICFFFVDAVYRDQVRMMYASIFIFRSPGTGGGIVDGCVCLWFSSFFSAPSSNYLPWVMWIRRFPSDSWGKLWLQCYVVFPIIKYCVMTSWPDTYRGCWTCH